MDTALTIITTVITVLGIVAAIITPVLRGLKDGKKSALDIALAIAEGIEDAKPLLPGDNRKVMTGALKNAAERKNVHDDVVAFLSEHKLNQ